MERGKSDPTELLSTAMTDVRTTVESQRLQCFAIWGGTGAVDEAVSVPGLDLYVCYLKATSRWMISQACNRYLRRV